MSAEFLRGFEWEQSPTGVKVFWTFPPRSLLPSVREVAELVVERPPA